MIHFHFNEIMDRGVLHRVSKCDHQLDQFFVKMIPLARLNSTLKVPHFFLTKTAKFSPSLDKTLQKFGFRCKNYQNLTFL